MSRYQERKKKPLNCIDAENNARQKAKTIIRQRKTKVEKVSFRDIGIKIKGRDFPLSIHPRIINSEVEGEAKRVVKCSMRGTHC
jgi:hypothetical protein